MRKISKKEAKWAWDVLQMMRDIMPEVNFDNLTKEDVEKVKQKSMPKLVGMMVDPGPHLNVRLKALNFVFKTVGLNAEISELPKVENGVFEMPFNGEKSDVMRAIFLHRLIFEIVNQMKGGD